MRAAASEGLVSAENRLFECAQLSQGAQIPIVGENNQAPFFDPKVCNALAEQAWAMGVRAEHCLIDATSPVIPSDVVAKMHAVDAPSFFSRLAPMYGRVVPAVADANTCPFGRPSGGPV